MYFAAPIKSVLFTNIKMCRGNNSYENRRQTIYYLKISRHLAMALHDVDTFELLRAPCALIGLSCRQQAGLV